jgi:DNA-binding response OmpR family regulator
MRTVLIADDDMLIREMVHSILADGGYHVVPVENGQKAWETIVAGGVDMAVLDLNMPSLDGLDLVKRLREDGRFKEMPIMMLTIRALVEDQLAGYERGVDDYLMKPFDAEMLLARIRALERRTFG